VLQINLKVEARMIKLPLLKRAKICWDLKLVISVITHSNRPILEQVLYSSPTQMASHQQGGSRNLKEMGKYQVIFLVLVMIQWQKIKNFPYLLTILLN
jgi:hypothetical protein